MHNIFAFSVRDHPSPQIRRATARLQPRRHYASLSVDLVLAPVHACVCARFTLCGKEREAERERERERERGTGGGWGEREKEKERQRKEKARKKEPARERQI